MLGYVDPATGVQLKPLGDGFIALVKMLISPIIFCTVVLGIAGAGTMKKVGRVGGKALIYFEVVSTFALAIGLVVANVIQPGAGFNTDPATLDANAVADYAKRATTQTTTGVHPAHHPDDVPQRVHRVGRSPAGPVRGDSLRLCDDPHGHARGDRAPVHRIRLADLLRDDERADEAGADRRRRRHGVHHRAIRRRFAGGRWRC